MTPLMLRQLWSLIESTQVNILLNLDDASLEQWLLNQVKSNCPLNNDEASVLNAYIRSKLSLIRDLAQERQMVELFG
ncbi:MAG: hypothetical protein N3E45_11640 [Oscillatoriaceae bacterium SKW80]|nr:hypothetical protein [Oscillatoriaceae bacterium SKYG93]MCX8121455.1 hypothetical protein [Oscillatoriaceae bacterium SKW80]MDW8452959.1 hypothetical protein [Oscillatoriaceae cyanobacterium SKYGB_i_bin93]HIK27803.1 hypothetical protein [Oscillatoriaceae cyanobacterium M7585_C2015_266]